MLDFPEPIKPTNTIFCSGFSLVELSLADDSI